MNRFKIQSCVSVIALSLATLATPAIAQKAPAADAKNDTLSEIVVTASTGSPRLS